VTLRGTARGTGSGLAPRAEMPGTTGVFRDACAESLRRRLHRAAAARGGGARALQRDCDGEPTRCGVS